MWASCSQRKRETLSIECATFASRMRQYNEGSFLPLSLGVFIASTINGGDRGEEKKEQETREEREEREKNNITQLVNYTD